MANKPCVAFLGPLGTYSHQIAHDTFQQAVEYSPQDSIAHVFHSVGPHTPLGVIPRENSIHGSVIETLDLFRQPSAGRDLFIRAQLTLKVQHCLLVRSGVKLEHIKRVWSHEQALGQCSRFLSEFLPDASREAKFSTGSAAQLTSTMQPDDPEASTTAVICSRLCLRLFPGLEILKEDIQNEKDNFTRFLVLSSDPAAPLPLAHDSSSKFPPSRSHHALIRVSSPTADVPDSGGHLRKINLATLLQALGRELDITNIDKRPSLSGAPFDSVYFVEVESAAYSDQAPKANRVNGANHHTLEGGDERCNAGDEDAFLKIINRNVRLAEDLGAHSTLLGHW